MRPLHESFREHALDSGLIPPAGRVMVAVSGGLDSVVLLHLVRNSFPDAKICVAHYDHAWRPESADDAHWVENLAREHGHDRTVERALMPSHTENDARNARYAFLQTAAAGWGADVIATAHHADDQAETILFRIARGTGTRGLRGIPARRGNIVRPLLPFHRPEIIEYARTNGLTWREDSSNLDRRHARNRIRHDVLPALERAGPGTTARLLAISELAAVAELHWDESLKHVLRDVVIERSERGFTLASSVILGYDPHTRARVLRILSRRLGTPLGRSGTDAASEFIIGGRSGSSVGLARDIRLTREFDRFVLEKVVSQVNSECDAIASIGSAQDGAARVVIGGRSVHVRWSVESGEMAGDGVTFDPAALRFPLVVRGWQPGDQIRMSYGSKKLKKLFVERRVSRTKRQQVPVLAERGSANVLWLSGIARAAVATPVSGAPIFRIRVENDDE